MKQDIFTNYFPTDWQRVLFRNCGKVPLAALADLLGTDGQTLRAEAEKLGLGGIGEDASWRKKGYVTLIRSNWHILPDRDIAQLLGIGDEAYRAILREDDFLSVKLGEKTECAAPVYAPLTEAQERETARIGALIRSVYRKKRAKPFDFYPPEPPPASLFRVPRGERILYSYSSLFGDLLDSGDFSAYSDECLLRLRGRGVTGVWIYGMLQKLSPCPFDGSLSEGYERRRKNLAALAAQCKKYGLGVYLYLNEPRALPAGKLPAAYAGAEKDGFVAFCMQKQASCEYLMQAVCGLMKAVPDLAGILTITMSENYTHCFSRGRAHCGHCAARPQDTAAEINNLICRGVKSAGSSARVIANLWGWSPFMNWDEEMMREGIAALDKDIEVMCVSEYGKKFCVGGTESEVIDYSLSQPGPSEVSRRALEYAASLGHKVWAKIQLNNSWECSSVPFVPVFYLQAKHLDALARMGIENFMLSWTLGGYPSPVVSLASRCAAGRGCDPDGWLAEEYGEEAPRVGAAARIFSSAFEKYPFSVDVLYKSPVTLGPGLLWQRKKIPLAPGMVCFPYDAAEEYSRPYGKEKFASLMEDLAREWQKGLALLPQREEIKFRQLYAYAAACRCHFLSAALYTRFVTEKQKGFPNRREVLSLLRREYENVLALYALTCEDACIGFEASNHYFYDENTLLEKLVCLQTLLEGF